MHRIIPSFLMIAAAVLASSCERGATPSTAIGGSASALVGDETTADTDSAISPAPGDELESTESSTEAIVSEATVGKAPRDNENDPEPLSVAWTDGADTAATATLSFTITNVTTDQTVAFSVSAVSKSIIGDGEISLGKRSLDPGESASFSLSANELPVRSDKVVSQLFVQTDRVFDSASGASATSHLAAMRFYRHSAGFETVRGYTEETLMSELDGALFDSPTSASATTDEAIAAEILGDKASSGGKRVQVSLATSGLVSYDEYGNVTGVMSFVGTGAGDASGEDAIVTPEEEPTADEMEASDE